MKREGIEEGGGGVGGRCRGRLMSFTNSRAGLGTLPPLRHVVVDFGVLESSGNSNDVKR